MKSLPLLVLTCGALVVHAAPSPANAGPVAPGFATSTFAANDDGATGAQSVGFALNYFGNTYSALFISNNGYVTFNSPQGTYTLTGLGALYSGQPIIAPFFADVDTRGTGSGLTSWGTGTYAGHAAFGVTWPAVGYYPVQTSKLNTFQVILTDRSDIASGDFDIYFNYDQIQWETGSASGGINGFGGISAAAGFNAGTGGAPGTSFQLPGSLVNGTLLDNGPDALISHINDGVPGQYLFQVRSGDVIVPPIGMPEPASLSVVALGFAAVGIARLRRR